MSKRSIRKRRHLPPMVDLIAFAASAVGRQCSKCGGSEFHGSCDGMEWALDRFADHRSYVRKCLDCGNVERTTREEMQKQTETSQGCADEDHGKG